MDVPNDKMEDIAIAQFRWEWVLGDRTDDDWLMCRYLFILELCAELGRVLKWHSLRNHAIPVHLQVLTTIGFLAMGMFQQELVDRSGISQSALSRVMPMVWGGIISLSNGYIRYPYTAAEQANIKMQFAGCVQFSKCNRSYWLHARCNKGTLGGWINLR